MHCPYWTTAVHESCHAVVGHEFRRDVVFISVEPSGQSLGRTTIPSIHDWQDMDAGDGLDPKVRRRIDRRERQALAILVAGDVGNHIESGGTLPLVSQRIPPGVFAQIMMDPLHHAAPGLPEKHDVKRALEMSIELPDHGMDEILRAEERARRILKTTWMRVMVLAKRLCKRGEMDREAIDAALR